jgi:hypothetical protein
MAAIVQLVTTLARWPSSLLSAQLAVMAAMGTKTPFQIHKTHREERSGLCIHRAQSDLLNEKKYTSPLTKKIFYFVNKKVNNTVICVMKAPLIV